MEPVEGWRPDPEGRGDRGTAQSPVTRTLTFEDLAIAALPLLIGLVLLLFGFGPGVVALSS